MNIQVKPSGSALRAEIIGADLAQPLDDATFAQIRAAFYQHEVLYFRGQALSDENQIRFSARFGELRKLRLASQLHVNHPEIFVVSNIVKDGKHLGSYDAGTLWHTDGAYLANPHAISALRALEVPAQDGRTLGDTNFASVSAAYDALPQSMKERLEGLQAVQSFVQHLAKTGGTGVKKDIYATVKADPEAIHPLVRVHPVNARRCLYLTEGYTARIVSLPEDESRDLIAELAAHCVKPEFTYLHNWRQHDLVLWDDCSTQHKATFDYPASLPRLMHRTTVMGRWHLSSVFPRPQPTRRLETPRSRDLLKTTLRSRSRFSEPAVHCLPSAAGAGSIPFTLITLAASGETRYMSSTLAAPVCLAWAPTAAAIIA